MQRTFKYRLYPTDEQVTTLDHQLCLCRQLYNAALEERITWHKAGTNVGYTTQANELPELKKGLPEYQAVYAQVLQDTLRRVDKAYKNFFRRCNEKKSPALRRMTSEQIKARIKHAFLATPGGFSPDRVVADPELNASFLAYCRELGLTQPDAELNQCLLNLRKAGELAGIRKSVRTSFPDADEYTFASEIAIRFLEREHHITLDHVICNPDMAREFDEIATRIAPGYSSLQYRWTALSLRKTRHLQPEILGHTIIPTVVRNLQVMDLNTDTIPLTQGLYFFFDSSQTLYVGETKNLRGRIAKHLDHSDNRGLAHWLWAHGPDELNVEYHVLPQGTTTRIRKAMERELIISRQPLLNIAGA